MHFFPLPVLYFLPFQYLLSKPVLIWNKSPGSVKHQVVDQGSFSSNRWLKHFMTNGHGTIARQAIFQLVLYLTPATNPGCPDGRSPEPGPHLPGKGPGDPAAGPSEPAPGPLLTPTSRWELASGSGRKSSAWHFRPETWETLILQKSYKAQPMPPMLQRSIF